MTRIDREKRKQVKGRVRIHLVVRWITALVLATVGGFLVVLHHVHPQQSAVVDVPLIVPEMPTYDSDRQKTTEKPRFVWHVGPMKTGTTTIQGRLALLHSTGVLERDGWHFASQSGQFKGIKQDDFVARFKEEMDRLRMQGKNVVLSNENYSVFYRSEDYRRIKEVLGDDWDVSVVIGYRPYFEWIPSMWSQKHKLTRKEISGERDYPWRNNQGQPTRQILPMFPDYYAKAQKGRMYADSVVEFVKPFFNIQMLHLYDSMGLLSKLVCDILHAPAACAESRHKDLEDRRANQGSVEPIHGNAIALAAAEQGLIDTAKWKRTAVIETVTARLHEITLDELPMVCPDQTILDRLWNRTLEMEAHVFPALAQQDPEREMKLREAFEKKVSKRTYCHVDLESVLSDPDWRNLLKTFA